MSATSLLSSVATERDQLVGLAGEPQNISPKRNKVGKQQKCSPITCAIIGLVLVGLVIPIASLAKKSDDQKEGRPCICNGKFRMSCPKASECKENKKSKLMPGPRDSVIDSAIDSDYWPFVEPHDDSHPDHMVDSTPELRPDPSVLGILRPTLFPTKIKSDRDLPRLRHANRLDQGLLGSRPGRMDQLDLIDRMDQLDREPPMRPKFRGSHELPTMEPPMVSSFDGNHIVRHRKVYVSKIKDETPVIAPIKIKIPLKLSDPSSLPEPKPVFQYKKYKTYESKPEIQMVPVTKTIIRPADVTPDQIIDDKGQKVSKDFDVKKL